MKRRTTSTTLSTIERLPIYKRHYTHEWIEEIKACEEAIIYYRRLLFKKKHRKYISRITEIMNYYKDNIRTLRGKLNDIHTS